MKKLLLIGIILLLSACGNQPIRKANRDFEGVDMARNAYQQGNYATAARLYTDLNLKYNDQRFIIWAAESYLQNKQYPQAQNIISKIAPTDNSLHLLVLTELAKKQGDNNKASYFFNKLGKISSGPWRNRYLLNRSHLAKEFGDYLEAGLSLIQLDEYNQRNENSMEIMNLLMNVSEQPLKNRLVEGNLSNDSIGWLEAVYANRFASQDKISQWKQSWPNHPAYEYFLNDASYNKIAVLLPLSGRYKNISKSIQQGMIAALTSEENKSLELRFFDTGSAGESFANAWYGAQDFGAEFVVGPLEKKSLAQLESMNSSTLPVMVLNSLDDKSNALGVYQFPLLAEDESIAISKRLSAESKKRVLLIAPETSSGHRLAQAFKEEFSFENGQVVAETFYQPIAKDFSNELKSILGLQQSRERIRRLRTMLKADLKSEPQIRSDIDAIVLFANAKLARLIKPQLKFHKAEDVPVYSTSQVYLGKNDRVKDKDLNGIKFTQSQFITEPNLYDDVLGFDAKNLSVNKKYFAFGYDAIALSTKLEKMYKQATNTHSGLSGQLSMDSSGVIHRELSWAQFRSGVPRYLEPISDENDEAQSNEL